MLHATTKTPRESHLSGPLDKGSPVRSKLLVPAFPEDPRLKSAVGDVSAVTEPYPDARESPWPLTSPLVGRREEVFDAASPPEPVARKLEFDHIGVGHTRQRRGNKDDSAFSRPVHGADAAAVLGSSKQSKSVPLAEGGVSPELFLSYIEKNFELAHGETVPKIFMLQRKVGGEALTIHTQASEGHALMDFERSVLNIGGEVLTSPKKEDTESCSIETKIKAALSRFFSLSDDELKELIKNFLDKHLHQTLENGLSYLFPYAAAITMPQELHTPYLENKGSRFTTFFKKLPKDEKFIFDISSVRYGLPTFNPDKEKEDAIDEGVPVFIHHGIRQHFEFCLEDKSFNSLNAQLVRVEFIGPDREIFEKLCQLAWNARGSGSTSTTKTAYDYRNFYTSVIRATQLRSACVRSMVPEYEQPHQEWRRLRYDAANSTQCAELRNKMDEALPRVFDFLEKMSLKHFMSESSESDCDDRIKPPPFTRRMLDLVCFYKLSREEVDRLLPHSTKLLERKTVTPLLKNEEFILNLFFSKIEFSEAKLIDLGKNLSACFGEKAALFGDALDRLYSQGSGVGATPFARRLHQTFPREVSSRYVFWSSHEKPQVLNALIEKLRSAAPVYDVSPVPV